MRNRVARRFRTRDRSPAGVGVGDPLGEGAFPLADLLAVQVDAAVTEGPVRGPAQGRIERGPAEAVTPGVRLLCEGALVALKDLLLLPGGRWGNVKTSVTCSRSRR